MVFLFLFDLFLCLFFKGFEFWEEGYSLLILYNFNYGIYIVMRVYIELVFGVNRSDNCLYNVNIL